MSAETDQKAAYATTFSKEFLSKFPFEKSGKKFELRMPIWAAATIVSGVVLGAALIGFSMARKA